MEPVSVCIPTHNRQADLARNLAELHRLVPPPDEIVVLADGCTDGTQEFIRREYPAVRLLENASPVHCVVGRNQLFAAATHEIILNLDDDSYPLELDFIARLRAIFRENPRLAVASFPQRTNEFPESLTVTDFGPPRQMGSYVNSASAVRRSTFLVLGGYVPYFYAGYDEPDYALRCVAAGWEVRYETGLTVRHHFSPVLRFEMRVHQRHSRNEFWSILLRCPWLLVPLLAPYRVWRQLGYAWKRGLSWCLREPQWWASALAGVPRCLAQRQALSLRQYLAWLRLPR